VNEDIFEKLFSLHHSLGTRISTYDLKISTNIQSESVIGGTFDRLHPGHESLISSALNVSNKVHIGVMSDEGVKKWGRKIEGDKIHDFITRVTKLEIFLAKYGERSRVKIIEIHDPFSYAIESEAAQKLDAIIVSEETIVLERARELNTMREKRGLRRLVLFKYPLVVDENGVPFSSGRLRKGEKILNITLPTFRLMGKEIINEVKKPKGELVNSPKDLPEPPRIVIAIGDIVVQNLIKNNYPISIAVIDKRSRRTSLINYYLYKKYEKEIEEVQLPIYLPALNPPGTITNDSWEKFYIALLQENPVVIRVYGEEDLFGFPATIIAPNESLVIYGQPPPEDKLVYFFVDDSHRQAAIELLMRMKVNFP